jgi:hypothetical protein
VTWSGVPMQDSELLAPIRELHQAIRRAVVDACAAGPVDRMSGVAADGAGDTLYAVDRVGEETLVAFFEREVAPRVPIVLIAEGLESGPLALPRGSDPSAARWRVIVDPIDGTRGLMYQKRSAWILTGVAPNKGSATTLDAIVLAVQTEIPTLKQHLCDVVWAERGRGASAVRVNRLTGEEEPIVLRPSAARDLAHGFGSVCRFFPGARDELAAVDEEVALAVLGPPIPGKALLFEDQYICTGGQLYELMAGHDRFIADLRPLMGPVLAARGQPTGLCCHPYDLCTALIAAELGVLITDGRGGPLVAPLAVDPDVAWVGYANAQIRAVVEPALQHALRRRGLL